MNPIAKLTSSDLQNIKAIAFDCDGVTVKRGTLIKEVGNELYMKVNQPSPDFIKKLNEIKGKYHLIFNSGRSSLYLVKMYVGLLWDNVSFISENGVFVLTNGLLQQTFTPTKYELDTIRDIRLELEKLKSANNHVLGFEPKQFITSLHCSQSVPEVDQIVNRIDYRHEFYCWWNDEAYDINPKRVNKGTGLQAWAKLNNLNVENIATVGNGINDHNMSEISGLSVSTDPDNLDADFYATGEHLGGEIVVDKILELS